MDEDTDDDERKTTGEDANDDERKSFTGQDKKKLNEDFVMFMRKRSDTEAPRYTARLKSYLSFREKMKRAEKAQRRADDRCPDHHRQHRRGKESASDTRTKIDPENKHTKDSKETDDGAPSANKHKIQRRQSEAKSTRAQSVDTNFSEPSDCGRRSRRRRCRRRRRRRSCRRRRRRRSCRRRRRRRSCRRRRRRRSCCRRRRRRC